MEILKSLENSKIIKSFKIISYKTFSCGFYIKVKASLINDTVLFIAEYIDEKERNYSYHWQNMQGEMIIRWDNSPYHNRIKTHPFHKHVGDKVFPSSNITIQDVIEYISKNLKK